MMSDGLAIPPTPQQGIHLPYTSSLSFSPVMSGLGARIIPQGGYPSVMSQMVFQNPNLIQRPVMRIMPLQQQNYIQQQRDKDEN
jgi:hypothetical protein